MYHSFKTTQYFPTFYSLSRNVVNFISFKKALKEVLMTWEFDKTNCSLRIINDLMNDTGLVESWWNRERLKVHKITDAKFVHHTVGRVGWRWTGTAPVGQCLLVGRGARECESCTWNRRFCAKRDDAFCPDRSSCRTLSEDCGESRPVDSHVSGIVHEVSRAETTERSNHWSISASLDPPICLRVSAVSSW